MVEQEFRKGPWTEQEDFKLVYFVGLFGDRRWDFIAKVSGLCRTGKSCRLRWVNYLHPDLKRGKMTPQEERLIMDLHSKWGNRWSRIARKLPGRTDNEIKNYWRTLMRKKRAQDKKKSGGGGPSLSSPESSSCCQSSSLSSNNNHAAVDSHNASKEVGEESFYDTGGPNMTASSKGKNTRIGKEQDDHSEQGYSMDDIWKDIAMSEDNNNNDINLLHPVYDGCSESFPVMPWDYCSDDPLWGMDEEASKMLFPDQYFSCYDQQSSAFLTG